MSRNLTIEDVKERYEATIMRLKDVTGVGIGLKNRRRCIVVYVKKMSPKLAESIPKKIEGFEVRIEETGELKALNLWRAEAIRVTDVQREDFEKGFSSESIPW